MHTEKSIKNMNRKFRKTLLVKMINWLNWEEYLNGTKVDTVRYSPVNFVGRASTKRCTVQFQVYSRLQGHSLLLPKFPVILLYAFFAKNKNKPFLSVKGLSIFFRGGGQDSLPAGGLDSKGPLKSLGGNKLAAPPPWIRPSTHYI